MKKSKSKNPRPGPFYGLLLLLTCLLISGVQGAMYVSMVDHTIGAIPFISGPPPVSNRVPPLSVALLKSSATSKMNPDHPDYYFDLALQWEMALREAGIEYRTIFDEELAAGVPPTDGVLVMPMASCLGDSQKKSIRKFLANGGGLVATGAMGSRDENCKWLGFDYLQDMTGMKDVSFIPASEQSFAIFRGGQYYSGYVPAGYRMELPHQEIIAGTAGSPDLYAGNWRMHPREGHIERSAIGVHGTQGLGRFAWFGFAETLPGRPASDRKMLDRLMVDAVRWTAKQPVAVLANWPGKNKIAAIVTEEIGGDFENAYAAAEVFKAQGIPATFFLQSSEARKAQGLVDQLIKVGEVASMGDRSDPLAEESPAKQAERLVESQRELSRYSRLPVVGLLPPMGLLDSATVTALKQTGFSYYIDSTEYESAVPDILEVTSDAMFPLKRTYLARIGRSGVNDFEAIAAYQGPSPWNDDMADAFLEDFQRTQYLGGAYTMALHGDLLGAPENLHIVEAALRKMKREPVWFTSASKLADWWASRNEVRVESRMVQGRRIRVAVTNRGGHSLKDASVQLHLPYRPKKVRMIPVVLGKELPKTELAEDEPMIRLNFAELRGQSSHVFVLALDEQ